MDLQHPKCAGLDIHQHTVVACARVVAGSTIRHERRTFGTTTAALLALSDWLTAHDCTHVAMESTGVYWKPIWQVLEGQFTLVLAHALHIRNIPGRKSAVNDATWIADLLAHGLLRGSFVPPAPVQELRDLTRTRKQLVREIPQHTLRIQKTLETANLELTGLLSNILGMSGRAILQALVAGETDPERLADLVHPRPKASRAALVAALHGRLTAHHRFLLQLHLTQVDALERPLPPPRRECRQAPLHPHPSQQSLVEDHPRASRLGRRPHQGYLPPSAIPPPQEPSRPQESHPRRRLVHAHRGLSHAQARPRLPGPRRRPLRPPGQKQTCQPPHPPPSGARFHRRSPGGVTYRRFLSRR